MLFRSLSLAFALLAVVAVASPAPAAAGVSPSFAPYVDDAFRRYGWTDVGSSFVRGRVDLATDPTDVPNTRNLAGMYWSSRIVIWEPLKLGDWMYETISHEYGHALEDARGENPATMGAELYDLLQLTQESDYPAAAWAARHVLQLQTNPTGDWMLDGYYSSMLDRADYAHLLLAVLERGAAFDVGRLPPWFRDAYFPHLKPNPPNPYPVRVVLRPETPPADYDRRVLRVKNLIAELCGPVMPGATSKPKSDCAERKRWPGTPFDPLPGAEGRGPASPTLPTQPVVPVALAARVSSPPAPTRAVAAATPLEPAMVSAVPEDSDEAADAAATDASSSPDGRDATASSDDQDPGAAQTTDSPS